MYTKDTSFGALVKQYIEKNDLSYQDLVDHLGYKSKTSVSRIIQDATSFQLRAQFYKQFSQHYALSAQEAAEFESALSTSRLSDEHQVLFSAYRRLFALRDATPDCEPTVEYSQSDRKEPFADLVREHGEEAFNIDVLIFGLCTPAILQTLYTRLDNLSCSFVIHHCLFNRDDASTYVHLLGSTADFLFDPRYILYHCDQKSVPTQVNNQIILHYDMLDGDLTDDLFLQLDSSTLFYSEPMSGELLNVYLRFFERSAMSIQPLKLHERFRTEEAQMHAYLSRQKQYTAQEAGHSIYCYRKSLGLEFIPPEIYKDAISLTRLPDKTPASFISELVDIQRKRYQNLRVKKTPSYFLLSQDALQNFIWTGRLRNHPYFLRPFSPRERVIVLKNLISLLESNPFFSLRFANDEIPCLWNDMSITCCQQIKNTSSHKASREEVLRLTPANETDDEYAGLQLSHPEIISSYALFFRDELWNRCTHSAKKSMHFLHLMLQYLASKGAS